ncbi:unnamed protein product, partial [Urochloa humidicola]
CRSAPGRRGAPGRPAPARTATARSSRGRLAPARARRRRGAPAASPSEGGGGAKLPTGRSHRGQRRCGAPPAGRPQRGRGGGAAGSRYRGGGEGAATPRPSSEVQSIGHGHIHLHLRAIAKHFWVSSPSILYMDWENNKERRPLGDLTNNTSGGNESMLSQGRTTLGTVDNDNVLTMMDASNDPSPVCDTSIRVDDPKSRKKENARTRQAARRAQMSQEQKYEINRKQRETKLRNKIQKSNKENNIPGRSTPGNVDNDFVLTMTDALNDPTPGCDTSICVDDPKSRKKEIARTRAAARRAQMSQEQKDEINRKQRERRLRNKIQKSNNQPSYKENINPGWVKCFANAGDTTVCYC